MCHTFNVRGKPVLTFRKHYSGTTEAMNLARGTAADKLSDDTIYCALLAHYAFGSLEDIEIKRLSTELAARCGGTPVDRWDQLPGLLVAVSDKLLDRTLNAQNARDVLTPACGIGDDAANR